MAKAEQLAGIVEKILSPKAEAEIEVSGFQVYVRLHTEKNADEIAKSAEKKGIAVIPIPQKGETMIMLNCANLGTEHYENAMKLLKQCLE